MTGPWMARELTDARLTLCSLGMLNGGVEHVLRMKLTGHTALSYLPAASLSRCVLSRPTDRNLLLPRRHFFGAARSMTVPAAQQQPNRRYARDSKRRRLWDRTGADSENAQDGRPVVSGGLKLDVRECDA